MQVRETEPSAKSKSHVRATVAHQAKEPELQGSLAHQRALVADLSSRPANAASAQTHASMLSRAKACGPAAAGHHLLQMQRQFGNRYARRVLALARQAEGGAEIAPEVEAAIQRARGGGQTLDSKVRTQMESAFGADFSGVRVHMDSEADMLNRALSARAFTTGQDIFFRQGEYNPGSSGGRELLAHELTHVVQQNGAAVGRKLTLGQPGDIYEQEAERVAQAIMQGERERVGRASEEEEEGMGATLAGSSFQRQPEEDDEQMAKPTLTSASGDHHIQRVCPACEEEAQRTQEKVSAPHAQASAVRHSVTSGIIQGGWRQESSTSLNNGSSNTSGNGTATHALLSNGVRVRARSWQTKPRWQWCIDGGTASVSWWKSTQYTFKHDGRDSNFIELTVTGQLSGGAKAEDLHYAKSGAAVVGLVKVRTPGSTTPAATRLFTIKDGGKSAANVSTVADIELSIPVNGTVKVTIPLKATSEGELADFSEALTPPVSHDVPGGTAGETIVDLYLAARGEAASDIESTCVPEQVNDTNRAHATALYSLVRWRDRAAPTATGATGAAGATTSTNRATLQLQSGGTHIDSVALSESRPITVAEGQGAVDTLIDGQSRTIKRACGNAGAEMKDTIADYAPNGVSCPPACGNVARKWCSDHRDYPRRIRVDLENWAGTNFAS